MEISVFHSTDLLILPRWSKPESELFFHQSPARRFLVSKNMPEIKIESCGLFAESDIGPDNKRIHIKS